MDADDQPASARQRFGEPGRIGDHRRRRMRGDRHAEDALLQVDRHQARRVWIRASTSSFFPSIDSRACHSRHGSVMELLSQQSGRLAGAFRAHEFEPPRRATHEFLPALHLPVLGADVRRRRSRGPSGQPDHRRHRAHGLPGRCSARRRRRRRDRRADRRRDRLHGGRLGQEGHRGQGRLAHQPDAQARPRNADRHPRARQAVRGHSGRGARLSSTATSSSPRRRRNSSPRTSSRASSNMPRR